MNLKFQTGLHCITASMSVVTHEKVFHETISFIITEKKSLLARFCNQVRHVWVDGLLKVGWTEIVIKVPKDSVDRWHAHDARNRMWDAATFDKLLERIIFTLEQNDEI